MSILITTVIYNNYSISYKKICLKLHSKFKISRGSKSTVNTLLISAKKDGYRGIGECVEYKRYNENLKDITKYLNNTKKQNDILKIKSLSLQAALQNALLDIKIQRNKKNFIKFLDLKKEYKTFITIPILSIDEILLKKQQIKKLSYIKITSFNNKAKIIIDANESWTFSFLVKNIKKLEKYNIFFIEQPFKAGQQNKLKKIKTHISFCADEDFYLNKKINNQVYKWVNLKIDKFGNDKKIKKIIKNCKKNKVKIMLGCMVSSSLSIVPALRFAKFCNALDLDGAMFLKKDYSNKVKSRA